MGSELNVCGKITIFLLVVLNILFAILGIVLIGVGSWLVHTGDDYAFITGNSVVSFAVLLIIAGIVTVVICVTGIIGAIFKWRPVLLVYAVVVTIIVILEIVAGILGFVFRDRVVRVVDERSQLAIELYNANADGATPDEQDATQLVDFIQNALGCCGYNNANDWINLNGDALLESPSGSPAPPGYNVDGDGCFECNPTTDNNCMTFSGVTQPSNPPNTNISVSFNVTQEGCRDFVQDNVVVFASVGGALGIVFGILEIAGILLSLFLCCCISSARRQEVV